MTRNKDVGGFLGETAELVGRNGVAALLYVLIVGGANALGLFLGYIDAEDTITSFGFGFSFDLADGLFAGLYQIALGVLSVVASYFMLAQFLKSHGRLLDSETRIWAYVGISILSILGIVLGLILLIIPGLILMVRWSASSGFLIGERMGIIDSLKASWEATRGVGWPIFFASIVLFVGLAIIGAIVGVFIGVLGINSLIAFMPSLVEAVGNVLSFAFGIAVFLLVHDNNDQIGEVFA